MYIYPKSKLVLMYAEKDVITYKLNAGIHVPYLDTYDTIKYIYTQQSNNFMLY